MSAEAMSNEYSEFGIDTILFAAQVIAKWTYHKGIDIIRADIPKEYRDRQIVNTIDAFEKVAQANGLTQIDENIAQEILNGGF